MGICSDNLISLEGESDGKGVRGAQISSFGSLAVLVNFQRLAANLTNMSKIKKIFEAASCLSEEVNLKIILQILIQVVKN
jgi:hypothetical protein